MRKLLTIGETAELLHMSASQIRYYEKEGLIHPARVDDNGYRLYDYDQTVTLEIIILLRNLAMPLKEIRETMKKGNRYDYEEIVNDSLTILNREISELEKKRHNIERMRDQFIAFKDLSYRLEKRQAREVFILNDSFIPENSIKEVYDFVQTHRLDYMDYNNELYMFYGENGTERLCLYDSKGKRDYPSLDRYTIPAGLYLSRTVRLSSYRDIPRLLDEFDREATSRGLTILEEKLSIDDLNTLLYSRDESFMTLQVRVEE